MRILRPTTIITIIAIINSNHSTSSSSTQDSYCTSSFSPTDTSLGSQRNVGGDAGPAALAAKADVQYPDLRVNTISFGSCHKSENVVTNNGGSGSYTTIWDTIRETLRPDVFLWIGDAIYTPTRGLATLRTLRTEYNNTLFNTTLGYSRFLSSSSSSLSSTSTSDGILRGGIHGTWDDHDYGGNDYGSEMPDRKERLGLFLDFLNVSVDDVRRKRNGAYYSVEYGGGGSDGDDGDNGTTVRIIFLDTRWGRDKHFIPSLGTTSYIPLGSPLACVTRWITAGLALPTFLDRLRCIFFRGGGGAGAGVEGEEGWCPRKGGRVLDDNQWEWLEHQLLHRSDSHRGVTIVVSSIQVLTTNPVVESWGHFPEERRRLLRYLRDASAATVTSGSVGGGAVVLLSGDVHHAEVLDAGALLEASVYARGGGDGLASSTSGSRNGEDEENMRGERGGRRKRLLEITSSGLTHSCTGPFYGKLCGPILDAYPLHRFRGGGGSSTAVSSEEEEEDGGGGDTKTYYYTGINFGSIQIDWGGNNSHNNPHNSGGDDTNERPPATMRISIHDQNGTEVLSTGSQPFGGEYFGTMGYFTNEEINLVADGTIDGHLLPFFIWISSGCLVLVLVFGVGGGRDRLLSSVCQPTYTVPCRR